MDLTGTALYMGSPSAYAQIVADLELDLDQFELTLRKEILWESETATDAEVRSMEMNAALARFRFVFPFVETGLSLRTLAAVSAARNATRSA